MHINYCCTVHNRAGQDLHLLIYEGHSEIVMPHLSLLMVMRPLPACPGMMATSLTSSEPPSSLLVSSGSTLGGAEPEGCPDGLLPNKLESGLEDVTGEVAEDETEGPAEAAPAGCSLLEKGLPNGLASSSFCGNWAAIIYPDSG